MYQPKVISYDLETCLETGLPSTEFHRPNFRLKSAAFSWRTEDDTIKSVVKWGEDEIRAFLKRIRDIGATVIVHNYAFEYGCTLQRLPEFADLPMVDTMRLLQNADNGGYVFKTREEWSIDEELAYLETGEEPDVPTGLSLGAGAKRWLPTEFHDHKGPYHSLIRERGGKTGHEGARLDLLTPDELARYNAADAEVTLRLYECLTEKFRAEGYDWTLDHKLYQSTARLVSQAKIRGVRVDRDRLKAHCEAKQAELDRIAADFRKRFSVEIEAIESDMVESRLAQYKTERGRAAAKVEATFNPRSTHQLAKLFVGKLGMAPKFLTAKGAPSFSSKFLKQWGDGGLILKKQRTVLLELKQGEALYALSAETGRWAIDIKVASTKSGRLSGGNNA
jgi:hypothetical protein